MSDTHAHAPAKNPFTPAEWEKFEADDRHAAALIIGLMAVIFTIGLVLYLYICLSI